MDKEITSEITISGIVEGSIAEEAGVEAGDAVISVNRRRPLDIFDYRSLADTERLSLVMRKKDGEILDLDIEKDEDEDLGLLFDDPLFDGIRKCRNKCVFCFIDQLPPGMRKTLYVKDDDYRLSFISGNYITLTNMSEGDIERIIRYRMTPVNISVHCTDEVVRRKLLGNPRADNIIEKIRRFDAAGIEVNCQIVLCRGLNDGGVLEKTLSELAFPETIVHSISVVPVGLTHHRSGLYPLSPFDRPAALEVLRSIGEWQERFFERTGRRTVYAADELYLIGDVPFPDYEAYDDFPQLGNGVGMVSLIRQQFSEALVLLISDKGASGAGSVRHEVKRTISVVTGVAAYDIINGFAAEITSLPIYAGKLEILVYGIRNEFFGDSVTVSGLVTGADIIEQLRNKPLGEEVLIPANMLKNGEEVLLDGYSLSDLQRQLGVKVTPVACEGAEFLRRSLGPLAEGALYKQQSYDQMKGYNNCQDQ